MAGVVPVPGTEPIYRPDADPRLCVGGCGQRAIARGMCMMHYKRVLKHGVLDIRPIREDAIRAQRRRVARWERARARAGGVTGWASCADFLTDVGEPPAGRVTLIAIDDTKPIGPGNWQWTPIKPGAKFSSRQEYDAARRAKPGHTRDHNLRKNYGIGLDAYDALLRRQGGVCAICANPETAVKRGKKLSLAVDHDHSTKAIRGLLCAKCNRMLGLAGDSFSVLSAAIDYLTRARDASSPTKEAA